MRIAFDAKRAFCNSTGLGEYSRTLISSLIAQYPQYQYLLYTPKNNGLYHPPQLQNVDVKYPRGIYKLLGSYWRSSAIVNDLSNDNISLYHGLSHEIPIGISKAGIKAVVTMHDLIFERYPYQYKKADVAIYRKKFRHACNNADKVIAISQQTKSDLIQFYNVPEQKIEVCYQSCNVAYQEELDNQTRESVRSKYNLPKEYLLYVGSVIERKNLLNICKALTLLKFKGIKLPLIVIGSGRDYLNKVKTYIAENNLAEQVTFLSEQENGIDSPGVRDKHDMPAIYQMATTFIYPSVFEGFGIPVLEALWSKTAVITSDLSCMPETGGDAAYYVDPLSIEEIATAIETLITDTFLREQMVSKGIQHAMNFTPEKCAERVIDVYRSLL